MDRPSGLRHEYFIFGFPVSDLAWHRYAVRSVLPADLQEGPTDTTREIRRLTARVNEEPGRRAAGRPALAAETLMALRTLNRVFRWLARRYFFRDNPGALERGQKRLAERMGGESVRLLHQVFVELFPPLPVKLARISPHEFLAATGDEGSGRDQATLEMLLLFLNGINPAARDADDLFDDAELRHRASFIPFVTALEEYLEDSEVPCAGEGSLFRLLRAPLLNCPDSLAGQLEYVRTHWAHLLPPEFLAELQLALDYLKEADVARGGEAGPPPVLEFGAGAPGYQQDEPEAFSADADWMSNVVLMAKSVYVWLDQLSRTYGRSCRHLNDVPDQELDRLAGWGVTGLWLIGLWERSEASRKIKQYMGNPDAAASAYALKDYRLADDLGGEEAWRNLRDRAWQRGIRLASDMVPNHMGIDSSWVVEHPEYFLQAEHPPYPGYSFTGGDLCDQPGVAVRIEDGYWDRRDAAVVFQRVDENTGRVQYIYHGNDGTSMPWNDTAQLNFLLPEVREAVIQVILAVARRFPIIRFDAAMTLARKHYQRLWFPAPGDAGAIPSRAEHGMSRSEFERVFPAEFWREVVDRVAAEVPDTLLLAEAFWLMEGFFVRTLGMHRVYNSAFMNMLKMEDNQKYRQTIKNVLEFSPEILKRFVNFMNNPDERTAVEQFGRGDKYFGCVLMLVTMPGLPMLGHGQVEGFTEKYGMEYRRAYWDEQPDHEMIARHEREIFPLMRRRHLFSGAGDFRLFDFWTGAGHVDENVFAYTNGQGGDHALIFYNNAYESTTGTIHHSCAFNTGAADAPTLAHADLADALGLDCSPGRWILYRDFRDRLEYLRPAAELAERGFPLSLSGYEYRAFLEFRSVADQDGSWRRLAEKLAGRGVRDLVREKRRLEIAPALAEVLSWVAPEDLEILASPLLQALAAADTPALGEGSRRDLLALTESAGKGTARDAYLLGVLLEKLPGFPGGPRSLRLAGCELGPADGPLLALELAEILVRENGTGDPEQLLRLASLLAAAAEIRDDLGRGKTAWLAAFLDTAEGADCLRVNRHEGQSWLVKESLEDLLDGLVFGLLTTGPEASIGPVLDARGLIVDVAEQAGYRVSELVTGLGRRPDESTRASK